MDTVATRDTREQFGPTAAIFAFLDDTREQFGPTAAIFAFLDGCYAGERRNDVACDFLDRVKAMVEAPEGVSAEAVARALKGWVVDILTGPQDQCAWIEHDFWRRRESGFHPGTTLAADLISMSIASVDWRGVAVGMIADVRDEALAGMMEAVSVPASPLDGKTIRYVKLSPPSPHDGKPDESRLHLHCTDGTVVEIQGGGDDCDDWIGDPHRGGAPRP